MPTQRFVLAVLLVCCADRLPAQQPNTLTAAERAQGWQLLFDGKTLANWHTAPPIPVQSGGRAPAQPKAQTGLPQQGSNPDPCKTSQSAGFPAGTAHWEVLDGAIVGCGDTNGYLDSDKTFRNFILALEFRTGRDTNSGVFVRSPGGTGGYEVQIWREQPAGFNTGSIVNVAKTERPFNFKEGEWNRYEISCEGDHLVVNLNGEKTLDVHDSKFAEGRIKLQYFKFPLAFRNIRIRQLP